MDNSLVEIEHPAAADVFTSISSVRSGVTEKKLSLMFGREEGAASRWLEGGSSTPTMQRLFFCFMQKMNRASTETEKLAAIGGWEHLVTLEGQHRGISSIFDSSSWTQLDQPANRPILGEDLLTLRDMLGITDVNDACWLFGLRIGAWGALTSQNPKMPVPDAALAILLRVLNDDLSLSPLKKPESPLDLFNEVKSFQSDLDKKKFAEIFGNEASSGYKWVQAGSRPGPAVRRLMLIFRKQLERAKKTGPSSVGHLLLDWENVLRQEKLSISAYLESHPDLKLR